MYKPLFQDSIIAVSIAVKYTISPKLVIGDATFYYIASLLKNFFFKLGPILAILVNSGQLCHFGQFYVPRVLEYWNFFPPFIIFPTMTLSLTFRHKTDILYKNLLFLTKFTYNGGYFEYLDFSN